MYGADPRLFPLGHQERLPPALRRGGRAPPARVRGPAHPRRRGRRAGRAAGRAARGAGGDRQAQRGRLRGGQRPGRPGRPAAAGLGRASAAEVARAAAGDAASRARTCRSTPTWPSSPSAAASSRSSITGAELRSPSVQLRVLPAGAGRAALDPRPAARRPERAELPRLPVPGRLRLRRGDHRPRPHGRATGWPARACSAGSPSTSSSCATSDGSWTSYAIEINLRKGGTTHPFLTLQFLTDGRYDAETGLFRHPRRRREAPGGHRPPRVAEPARRCASTTCSTSSPGTACTSTRPGRPASSCT